MSRDVSDSSSRYLVTGGAGFIGSHLVELLVGRGCRVCVLDDFSTGCRENLAHLEACGRLEIVRGTILDPQTTEACVARADRVYHLASAVGVQLIIDEPVKTIRTIVEGTASVLGACARQKKPVLIASTSEVYGKSPKAPFSETDDSVIGPPMFRRWSYACSKAVDEFMALAHAHQDRLPVVIARLFNVIGPRQTGRYGMVVPRFVRQALAGEPITVYGDGRQTRCFCHVADVVGALDCLLHHPETCGEIFNVGTDREISINDLAELVRRITGNHGQIRHIPYGEAYGPGFEDMERRVPDLAKIRKWIGYQPRRSLEETIEDIVAAIRKEGA